jgi:hypothetical protein
MSTEVLYSTGRKTEKGRAVMDSTEDVRCASTEGDKYRIHTNTEGNKYIRSVAKKMEIFNMIVQMAMVMCQHVGRSEM